MAYHSHHNQSWQSRPITTASHWQPTVSITTVQGKSLRTGRPDTLLLLVILTMTLLGLLMVQSASQYADPIDPSYYARKDALWSLIGAVALFCTLRIDYHYWRWLAIPGICGALLLLALVTKMGINIGGAQRWLSFGSFLTFQPSELAKLAFVLFSAVSLAYGTGKGLLRYRSVVLVGGGIIGLVLMQNDLGTALVLAACAGIMLIVGGIPVRPFLLGVVGMSASIALVIGISPFRRARMLAFIHPLRCQSDISYHICQSLVALGSGGLTGRGLGDSLQKTGYLPAPFTDSIFAVIGEELGFIGTMGVIILIAIILWRGLRIAMNAPDSFGTLLASGITCWLGIQAMLNIGSSIAAIPFTGVPLPFISFGGSSLVISLAAMGIVLNISRQPEEVSSTNRMPSYRK